MDKIYEDAASILEDIWVNIDWDMMNRGRMVGIRDEFANKIRALSRCYANVEPFLERLCRAFGSRMTKEETKIILETIDKKQLMKILREETQIVVLLLQIKRDEKKNGKSLFNS